MARPRISRRNALILAGVLSVALFAAGLLSGLAASKIMEQRVQQRTQQETSFFVDYVNKLDDQLQSTQIQESFVNSLDEEKRCALATTYFAQVAQSLNYYWQRLPSRLEQYEQGRVLSPEYLQLKDEYTKLSLRAWIIARDNERQCNTTVRPILYFYDSDCQACVAQGEVLDEVKAQMTAENITALPFTNDLRQNESAIRLIRTYYNITTVPALVIDDTVLQGRVHSAEEIIRAMEVAR